MKRKTISFLEKKTKAFLKKKGLNNKTFLLAVSGGFDSMLMMEVFHRIKKDLSLKLYVGHVHHGRREDLQGKYRDEVLKKVCREALKRDISFFSNERVSDTKQTKGGTFKQDHLSKLNFLHLNKKEFLNSKQREGSKKKENLFRGTLQSEEAQRKWRYFVLRKIKEKTKSHFILLSHFKSDLLETRLIRLIRGTGGLGLRAMSEMDKDLIRPFLFLNREDFILNAKKEGISYKADPSNKDLSFLRNWIRHKFLSSLEKVRPGSSASLFRSLENISKKKENQWNPSKIIEKGSILYSLFLELDHEKKISVLSYYMRERGLRNYTLNHINEVLKRLRGLRKRIHFKMLKVDWEVDSKCIKIK